jgi:predicted ATPase with chaperone activity
MLARQLTTILPAMTLAEALKTTRLHRVIPSGEVHLTTLGLL